MIKDVKNIAVGVTELVRKNPAPPLNGPAQPRHMIFRQVLNTQRRRRIGMSQAERQILRVDDRVSRADEIIRLQRKQSLGSYPRPRQINGPAQNLSAAR